MDALQGCGPGLKWGEMSSTAIPGRHVEVILNSISGERMRRQLPLISFTIVGIISWLVWFIISFGIVSRVSSCVSSSARFPGSHCQGFEALAIQ